MEDPSRKLHGETNYRERAGQVHRDLDYVARRWSQAAGGLSRVRLD